MKYVNVEKCVNCNGILKNSQVMYSDGVCPLCGHKGANACTIVETVSDSKAISEFEYYFGWAVLPFCILSLAAIMTVIAINLILAVFEF